MTIEEAVYSLLIADTVLKPLVGQRIYPLVAPQDADFPVLLYQEAGHSRLVSLGGITQLRSYRLRLDTYTESYAQAKRIRDAIAREGDGGLLSYSGTVGDVVIKGIRQEDTSDDHLPPVHADERGLFSAGIDLVVYYTGGS